MRQKVQKPEATIAPTFQVPRNCLGLHPIIKSDKLRVLTLACAHHIASSLSCRSSTNIGHESLLLTRQFALIKSYPYLSYSSDTCSTSTIAGYRTRVCSQDQDRGTNRHTALCSQICRPTAAEHMCAPIANSLAAMSLRKDILSRFPALPSSIDRFGQSCISRISSF